MVDRIAVDARVLGEEQTGVATYTRSLLSALAVVRFETEWLLYSHRPLPVESIWTGATPGNVETRVIRFPTPMWFRPIWEHGLLPLRLLSEKRRPDLWFSPLSVVPRFLGSLPAVVTIHDLAFERYPWILPRQYRVAWGRSLRHAAKSATGAICVSESTRRDWIELASGRESDSIVVHEGVDLERFRVSPRSSFRLDDVERPISAGTSCAQQSLPAEETFEKRSRPGKSDDAAILSQHGIQGDYLLAVGTLEPRKNYGFLLDLYGTLRQKIDVPPLVVAGGDGWCSEALRVRIEHTPGVKRLGYVPHEHLPTLYRSAAALLFPTLYEGFGLPVLEAMASGTPVAASDIPVCREIGGEAARYATLDDTEAWTATITDILEAPPEAGTLRQHAESFTWQKAAESTWAYFDRCQER